eukprot:scaffold651_cov174-Ochromonas_danica.AAC.22
MSEKTNSTSFYSSTEGQQVDYIACYGNYHMKNLPVGFETAARITQAEALQSFDPGHVAAINVSLYNDTNGKLGMSIEQAREFKKYHTEK